MGFTQNNGENVAAEQEDGREPKETCQSIKFEAKIHSPLKTPSIPGSGALRAAHRIFRWAPFAMQRHL